MMSTKLVGLLIILVFLLFYQKEGNFTNLMNIYNQPLKECAEGNMSSGSWDESGKCSELGEVRIKYVLRILPTVLKVFHLQQVKVIGLIKEGVIIIVFV